MAELETDTTHQHGEDTDTESKIGRDHEDKEQTDVQNEKKVEEGGTHPPVSGSPVDHDTGVSENEKEPKPNEPSIQHQKPGEGEDDQGDRCQKQSSGTNDTNPGDGGDGGRIENLGSAALEPAASEDTCRVQHQKQKPSEGEDDQGDRCQKPSSCNNDTNPGDGGDGGRIENLGSAALEPAASGDTGRDEKKAEEGGIHLTVSEKKEEPKPAESSNQKQKPQEEEKTPETIASSPWGNGEDDQVDGYQEPSPDNRETTTGAAGGGVRYLMAVCIVVVVAIVVQQFLQPESPPQKDNMRQVDVFLRQMERVKTRFPNQRAELWQRSRIHLQRHLLMAQPTEPVSLILTASRRAEGTLRCLAEGLASAFSSALNASVLHIDGASKARQDSDEVKLDIDSQLKAAFEGDKPTAVIHRLDELPPGSTLIFYRYCDHENAAYKNIFLVFTVLLGEEEEIPAKTRLSAVEEMVDDHLKKKFLSHEHPVSFDRMDLNKYGGLWSRISHLILPVAAEERMEHEGCQGT